MAQTVVPIVILQFVVPSQLGLNGAHVQSPVVVALKHVIDALSQPMIQSISVKLKMLIVMRLHVRLGHRGDHGLLVARDLRLFF